MLILMTVIFFEKSKETKDCVGIGLMICAFAKVGVR